MNLCVPCHRLGHPAARRRDPIDTRHCYKVQAFEVRCGHCGAMSPATRGRVYYDCHHYDFRKEEKPAGGNG